MKYPSSVPGADKLNRFCCLSGTETLNKVTGVNNRLVDSCIETNEIFVGLGDRDTLAGYELKVLGA